MANGFQPRRGYSLMKRVTSDKPEITNNVSMGMTLVEVIVVICIVAILGGIMLPAVVFARESARAAQCRNNLRTIGMACQIHASTFAGFPPFRGPVIVSGTRGGGGAIESVRFFSFHSRLLPYLGETHLYSAINFDRDLCDYYSYRIPGPGEAEQRTALVTTLDYFLCPSDGMWTEGGRSSATNYRVNLGAGHGGARDLAISRLDGPVAWERIQRLERVTDGLSHTALISEKPRGHEDDNTLVAERDALIVNRGFGTPGNQSEYLSACIQQRWIEGFTSSVGRSWLIGSPIHNGYTASLPPNPTWPDCTPGTFSLLPIVGILSARSHHPGLVNVLFCDCSVSTRTNGIAPSVWAALHTRAGGEIVENP